MGQIPDIAAQEMLWRCATLVAGGLAVSVSRRARFAESPQWITTQFQTQPDAIQRAPKARTDHQK
jgi:hypothetical protein